MVNYKKYLYFFFSIILIFKIYYVYFASLEFPNSYSSSEILINYSSGFVRRGLIGELFIFFYKSFNLKPNLFFFIFNLIIYFLLYFLIFILIKKSKRIDPIYLILVLSPVFISYSLYEKEALIRKEIYLFISFLIFIIFLKKNSNLVYSYIAIFILTTFVILVHESNIIFSLFFWIIFFFKFIKRISLKTLILLAFPITLFHIILILLFIINPISSDQIFNMCNYTKSFFSDFKCGGGFFWLSQDLSFSVNEVIHSTKIINTLRYLITNIIIYLPIIYFFILSNNKKNFYILLLALISFPLYFVGLDWGRWININYTMLVFLLLYLRNEGYYFVEVINLRISKIKISLICIYLLGWNVKLLNTDNIGSIPLIRIFFKVLRKIYQLTI